MTVASWTRYKLDTKETIFCVSLGIMTKNSKEIESCNVENLRKCTFIGTALSTVATLTAIVVVPMLYNYAQYVQSSLQVEVDFCRQKTVYLWDEYTLVSPPYFHKEQFSLDIYD